MRETWEVLVEQWLGLSLPQGRPLVVDLPADPGASPGLKRRRSSFYRGPAGADLELATLESVTTIETPAETRDESPGRAHARVGEERYEILVTLLTDTATLRPLHLTRRVRHPGCDHINAESVESCDLTVEWPSGKLDRHRR